MTLSNVLSVRDLQKVFETGRRGRVRVTAVDGVTFNVAEGETLGVVGESGCGKSTLGRMLVGLLVPTSGSIVIDGVDTAQLRRAEWKPLRRTIQMVFQDPYSSLNPKMTVMENVGESLRVHGLYSRSESPRLVNSLLDHVGLSARLASSLPRELSGGQRQRVGIARALVLQPRILVLDEPVSALDVSIQAQIVNLLNDLQREFGLTIVLIAHDLALVRRIVDRIAVMYMGRFVEIGAALKVFAEPQHPYTAALRSAIPDMQPGSRALGRRIRLDGELPNPADLPSGCRFRTRCWRADERCQTEDPPLSISEADGISFACHHPLGVDTHGGHPTAES